jgi:hypothetical protein
MFTGFASENTPAIQVWDFFRTYAGTARISLADDCAPIQFVRTSGNTTTIEFYLPTSPIEGKQIKIINARYGVANAQSIQIRSSDANGNGSEAPLALIGPGQTIDLCYSKNFISFGSFAGQAASGWITLNQTPASSGSRNSVVLGGYGNSAQLDNSVVIGGQLNLANGQLASVIAGQLNTSTGQYSAVVGGESNIAGGVYSGILGGYSNTANGGAGVIVGGNNNSASGSNAAVVGGNSNTAGNQSAVVLGGQSNIANNSYSAVVSGLSNTASSSFSVVLGGSNNTANSSNSAIIGGAYGNARSINGNFVYPASVSPISTTTGVQQLATLLLGRQTTDATATVLASNNSAAGTTNQVILPNNSAYTFQGTCIANVTGGSTTSGWKFEGVIKRGANAASTALVAAVTPTVIAQDAGAAAWVLAITADTTNGGIKVEVTGAAATTIRWVTKIETTEVTF